MRWDVIGVYTLRVVTGEVVLAGLESGSKVVGLSSFACWWRRTVTIERGGFGREKV